MLLKVYASKRFSTTVYNNILRWNLLYDLYWPHHTCYISSSGCCSSSSVNPPGQRLPSRWAHVGVERGVVAVALSLPPSRLNVPLCLWTPYPGLWPYLYPWVWLWHNAHRSRQTVRRLWWMRQRTRRPLASAAEHRKSREINQYISKYQPKSKYTWRDLRMQIGMVVFSPSDGH